MEKSFECTIKSFKDLEEAIKQLRYDADYAIIAGKEIVLEIWRDNGKKPESGTNDFHGARPL